MSKKKHNKFKRLSWDQYTIDMVETDKEGLAAINQEVYDMIHERVPGLYIYTTKNDYFEGKFKTGQVVIQTVYERIVKGQLTSHSDLVLIVGVIPTEKVIGRNYDQEIHCYLHDQDNNGVEWLYMTTKKGPGKEWSQYRYDVDPVEVWKSAVAGNQTRFPLSLTLWQLEAVDRVLLYASNKKYKKVLEELAARFGKTTTMLAAFSMMKEQVMVVCAYYTTSFSSFSKEVYRFSQFEDMRVLELKDPDFKEKFDSYIFRGKKVVVLATLHESKNVEENHTFVSEFKNKFVVTDEADYGAHTETIAPKVDMIANGALTILMTGTNSERAVGDHHHIDHYASVTYFDMIAMAEYGTPKIQNQEILSKYPRNKLFESLIAKPFFWQFDYSKYVPIIDGFEEFAPSFSKVSSDVNRARSFWHGLYTALTGIHKNMDANSMDIFNCLAQKGEEVKDVIQFVSMKKVEMLALKRIARTVLGDRFEVHVINGDNTTNEKAEKLVKNMINNAAKKGKNVWIIASNMCQRSFSIPSINCVILTYDKGDKGATVQRISRGLTNSQDKTHSHIFSISIDGNRDEKINYLILDAAETLAEREDISIPEALRKVYKTYPIFQNDEDGYVCQMTVDEYTREIVNSSNLHLLAIDKNNVRSLVESGEIFDLFDGKVSSNSETLKTEIGFSKVETYMTKPEHERTEKEKEEINKFIKEFQKNLVIIMDNFKYVTETYKKSKKDLTYESLMEKIRTEDVVYDTLGTTPEVFEFLIEKKAFSEKFLSLFVETK